MVNSAPHLGDTDVLLAWRKQRPLLKFQSTLAETSALPQHPPTCQSGGSIEGNQASQACWLLI